MTAPASRIPGRPRQEIGRRSQGFDLRCATTRSDARGADPVPTVETVTLDRVSSDPMRVGVLGLGDIARKAYLPVLTTRADIEVRLCTRNRETLNAIGDSYHIDHRYADVESLLVAGIDAAFVHVATSAHVDVVSRLLRAGVPTYVDKPLADNIDDCVKLAELARSKDTSLLVGFNRRYAPIYRELVEPPPALVFMQKNRVGLPDETRRFIFDDFVHVVDTLRFLAPQTELVDVRCAVRAGRLELVLVHLAGPGVTAIGSMNRTGGDTQELLETQGAGLRRVVHDMATIDSYRGGQQVVVRRGDWTSVQEQRGFGGICTYFLESVRNGRVLDTDEALRTHELCEQIVTEVKAAAS
jgi:virulence factor